MDNQPIQASNLLVKFAAAQPVAYEIKKYDLQIFLQLNS